MFHGNACAEVVVGMAVNPRDIRGAYDTIQHTCVNQASRSSDELIRACIEEGNEAAWEEFVRRFRGVIAGTVVRTARRFGASDPQLIDDLVQDTYLKICANRCRVLREFQPQAEESIFGLLRTVAFSVTQDHFRGGLAAKRGAGGQEIPLDRYTESALARHEGLPPMERQILLGQIDKCLAGADEVGAGERDRQIFWLYYRHGMTSRAIAAISRIGLTQKGVESVIQRLTSFVKRRMAEGNSSANPL